MCRTTSCDAGAYAACGGGLCVRARGARHRAGNVTKRFPTLRLIGKAPVEYVRDARVPLTEANPFRVQVERGTPEQVARVLMAEHVHSST